MGRHPERAPMGANFGRVSRAQRSMTPGRAQREPGGMMPPAFAGAGLQPGIVTKTEFGTRSRACQSRAGLLGFGRLPRDVQL